MSVNTGGQWYAGNYVLVEASTTGNWSGEEVEFALKEVPSAGGIVNIG